VTAPWRRPKSRNCGKRCSTTSTPPAAGAGNGRCRSALGVSVAALAGNIAKGQARAQGQAPASLRLACASTFASEACVNWRHEQRTRRCALCPVLDARAERNYDERGPACAWGEAFPARLAHRAGSGSGLVGRAAPVGGRRASRSPLLRSKPARKRGERPVEPGTVVRLLVAAPRTNEGRPRSPRTWIGVTRRRHDRRLRPR
jgi:hypothetical protein